MTFSFKHSNLMNSLPNWLLSGKIIFHHIDPMNNEVTHNVSYVPLFSSKLSMLGAGTGGEGWIKIVHSTTWIRLTKAIKNFRYVSL